MQHSATATYRRYTFLLILFLSAFRILIAFFLEFGNDESYYWLYSQKLQWNYFDHPPVVAFWTKLFTLNLLLDNSAGFLRIGSIVGCALASLFLYQTVNLLHSPKAGYYVACLYNASIYAGLTAGLYLTPDAPQMVFWTICMWMIVRITKDEKNWTNWILFGIAAGLCIMSKVHGAFVCIGLGLFILFSKRAWLQMPQLYVAALITLVISSPILFWNIHYSFATYRFHSQRVAIEDAPFNRFAFPREVLHQFLWNNSINVILIMFGILAWKRKKISNQPALSIFFFIGAPLALLLLFISLFRDTVLPHWSGPAYVSLLPFAAIWLAGIKKGTALILVKSSLLLFLIALVGWSLLVKKYPGNLGKKRIENYGQGDISLDLYGWQEAGEAFGNLYSSQVKKGLASARTPIVCTYWWGAHIEYYFARPQGLKMIGLGSMNGLHHYLWVNKWRKEEIDTAMAYCIMPSDDNYNLPVDYYKEVKQVATITVKRGGKPAHFFRVYKLIGLLKPIPIAY